MKPAEIYTNDNLKFRRAFVRERLMALKNERITLTAEKEQIERQLEIEATEMAAKKAMAARMAKGTAPRATAAKAAAG